MQGLVRDVVSTDLVRDHYVKSYSFSTPDDGRIQLNVEVRYEIRNYSEAVRDYAPELTAETFFQPEFRFLEYGIAGRKIYTFSDENLVSKLEIEETLGVTRVPRSALPALSLKPVKAGEKAACQVTWRYGLTVPEQYCDVTDLDEATLGATLHVEAIPEELNSSRGAMPACTTNPAASRGTSKGRSSRANISAPGGFAASLQHEFRAPARESQTQRASECNRDVTPAIKQLKLLEAVRVMHC